MTKLITKEEYWCMYTLIYLPYVCSKYLPTV